MIACNAVGGLALRAFAFVDGMDINIPALQYEIFFSERHTMTYRYVVLNVKGPLKMHNSC